MFQFAAKTQAAPPQSPSADIPSLSLSDESYLASSRASSSLLEASSEAFAKTPAPTTTSLSNEIIATKSPQRRPIKIVTGSGLVFLAAVGGISLGRTLLRTENDSDEMEDDDSASANNNNKSFSGPMSLESSNLSGDMSTLDVSTVRRDFETINVKDKKIASAIQEAQSLLSNYAARMANSSHIVSDIVGGDNTVSDAAGPAVLSQLQERDPSSSKFSRKETKERTEQARKVVEQMLARAEQAEQQALALKREQVEMAQEMVTYLNETNEQIELEASQVQLPPPLEDTEFADWVDAVPQESTPSAESIEDSPSAFFVNATGDPAKNTIEKASTTTTDIEKRAVPSPLDGITTNFSYVPQPQPKGYTIKEKPREQFPSIQDMYEQRRPMSKSQMRAFVNDMPFQPEPPKNLPPPTRVDPNSTMLTEEVGVEAQSDEQDSVVAKSESKKESVSDDDGVGDKTGELKVDKPASDKVQASNEDLATSGTDEANIVPETPTELKTDQMGENLQAKKYESIAGVGERDFQNKPASDGSSTEDLATPGAEPTETEANQMGEDLQSKKYESIADVGERAFEILKDLGMVETEDDNTESSQKK